MSLSIAMMCHSGYGGSVRVAVELSRALTTLGHEVHLLSRSHPPGVLPGGGLTVHTLDARPPTAELDPEWSACEIARFGEMACGVVRRHRIDLLHFHYALPFIWVMRAIRSTLGNAAPPVVGTLHGTDVSASGRMPSALRTKVSRALREATVLTTVSRDHARLAAAAYGVSARVIPNFVDLEEFRPGPAHPWPPRIAHVSNFREVKQPESMARIAGKVLERAEGELWLIGDGARMPVAEAVLTGHAAAGRVRHWGLRPAVAGLLGRTDVLLVTSGAESFSLASLEAMACAVPVVAPRVGGVPELVQDGATGYLFDPGDEEAAARHLLALVTNPELRAQMGQAGRATASAFCTSSIVPAYDLLYSETVERSRSRAPAPLEGDPRA
ncbi:glycosyltransferase [Streptomyces sp. NPDC057910]|uniref:glycosyltransferase n=1 Tax=Streptomyces sp. NPDC057910 TaxID=3346278 RepID=UPI0036ECEF05